MDKFKYLGSIIKQKADNSYEIKARLGAARSAFRSLTTIWKDRALNKAIKLKIPKTTVWPVAVYGCESWTLRAADSKRLQILEMSCYRRMLKINWTEQRTNDSLLSEIGTKEKILETVKRRKQSYSTLDTLSEHKIYALTYYMSSSKAKGTEEDKEDDG